MRNTNILYSHSITAAREHEKGPSTACPTKLNYDISWTLPNSRPGKLEALKRTGVSEVSRMNSFAHTIIA
jgi:hypothetical protein